MTLTTLLTNSEVPATEKVIQIEAPSNTLLYALTDKGRVYKGTVSTTSVKWVEVKLP